MAIVTHARQAPLHFKQDIYLKNIVGVESVKLKIILKNVNPKLFSNPWRARTVE